MKNKMLYNIFLIGINKTKIQMQKEETSFVEDTTTNAIHNKELTNPKCNNVAEMLMAVNIHLQFFSLFLENGLILLAIAFCTGLFNNTFTCRHCTTQTVVDSFTTVQTYASSPSVLYLYLFLLIGFVGPLAVRMVRLSSDSDIRAIKARILKPINRHVISGPTLSYWTHKKHPHMRFYMKLNDEQKRANIFNKYMAVNRFFRECEEGTVSKDFGFWLSNLIMFLAVFLPLAANLLLFSLFWSQYPIVRCGDENSTIECLYVNQFWIQFFLCVHMAFYIALFCVVCIELMSFVGILVVKLCKKNGLMRFRLTRTALYNSVEPEAAQLVSIPLTVAQYHMYWRLRAEHVYLW